ncbi:MULTISPECIES: zinc ABC transporter ATP-binding protein AztA [Microbacterium]|uniref:zinc ABC transporter ATP-binding protein AztA n=1 Tax=Microbacterium TaxID=33882 RepID=UPI0019502761|nr:zinc ABC transporter ATP-binding protein AztA [Microbacterium sp. KCTC 39802]
MPSGQPPMSALSVRGIHVDFAGKPALRGVDLDAATGAITVIAGPNGAGKSTLLEVLAGTLAPSRGVVKAGALSRAFVPQRAAVSETLPLTVRDVVTVGAWGRTSPWRRVGRDGRHAVDEALELLDLGPLQRSPFGALSGGQRQRALLAQGLARGADVLLLDEPTTALDSSSAARITDAVTSQARRGVVVVCVSHDPALIELGDVVIRLDAGCVASVDGAVSPVCP